METGFSREFHTPSRSRSRSCSWATCRRASRPSRGCAASSSGSPAPQQRSTRSPLCCFSSSNATFSIRDLIAYSVKSPPAPFNAVVVLTADGEKLRAWHAPPAKGARRSSPSMAMATRWRDLPLALRRWPLAVMAFSASHFAAIPAVPDRPAKRDLVLMRPPRSTGSPGTAFRRPGRLHGRSLGQGRRFRSRRSGPRRARAGIPLYVHPRTCPEPVPDLSGAASASRPVLSRLTSSAR